MYKNVFKYCLKVCINMAISPFMYYDLPTQDVDQLDLPISPHGHFYIKKALLYSNDDPQIIIRTERERLRTFYSVNARPQN